jgi:hypothetical protein
VTRQPDAGRPRTRPLAPRQDPMSAVWALTVTGIVALIFLLAFLGLPSRLIPEPTPLPIPSFALPSVSPSLEPSLPASPTQSPQPS